MFIQQADLFRGMNKDFVKKVFDITSKESLNQGDVLFREGDHARHFYILLKGRARQAGHSRNWTSGPHS